MNDSPVRIGIIGCGNVLSAYRAEIDKLRLKGLAEVALACGRAVTTRARLRRTWHPTFHDR